MILFCQQANAISRVWLQSISPAPLRNTFSPHLHFSKKKNKRYYKASIAVNISCFSSEYFITALPAIASSLFWKAIHAIHDSNVQNMYLSHSLFFYLNGKILCSEYFPMLLFFHFNGNILSPSLVGNNV